MRVYTFAAFPAETSRAFFEQRNSTTPGPARQVISLSRCGASRYADARLSDPIPFPLRGQSVPVDVLRVSEVYSP